MDPWTQRFACFEFLGKATSTEVKLIRFGYPVCESLQSETVIVRTKTHPTNGECTKSSNIAHCFRGNRWFHNGFEHSKSVRHLELFVLKFQQLLNHIAQHSQPMSLPVSPCLPAPSTFPPALRWFMGKYHTENPQFCDQLWNAINPKGVSPGQSNSSKQPLSLCFFQKHAG